MANSSKQYTLADLDELIQTYPVIDNHAHNIYRPDGLRNDEELLGITSEASGPALEDARTTLAHIRGAKMLKELLGLPKSSTWEDILKKRKDLLDRDADDYLRKCFQGSQTLLLDDKYEDDDAVELYSWHDKFTLSPCKRIERMEAVAADILEEMHEDGKLPVESEIKSLDGVETAWKVFLASFDKAITSSINDPEVVAFKSIICYETGLDVNTTTTPNEAFQAFQHTYLPTAIENDFSISTKPLNDFLLLRLCTLLTTHSTSLLSKPLQLHTGLGSNNEQLLLSNPAYLQPLIAEYPHVVFVILHCAYPYTREAGYLASVYKNCYLDVGLVWPEVSRAGQEGVLREALELTPWGKMMWSTDGHYFPETYYLAGRQGRVAMGRVVRSLVEEGDLEVTEAVELVKAVYFGNAQRVYGLGLNLPEI